MFDRERERGNEESERDGKGRRTLPSSSVWSSRGPERRDSSRENEKNAPRQPRLGFFLVKLVSVLKTWRNGAVDPAEPVRILVGARLWIRF